MKKVLIISYYFPPVGLGGSQRISKLCKYLRKNNWQPYVLTVKNIKYYQKDDTLLQDLTGVNVIKTGSFDPLRIAGIFSKNVDSSEVNKTGKDIFNIIDKYLFIPDSKILWLPFLLRKAVKLIKSENIEIVLTSSPPNSVHIAGLILKKISRIKWVADFRDKWTSSDFFKSTRNYQNKINRRLEEKVAANSDYVTAASDSVIDDYGKIRKDNKLRCIYNGYDEDDFPESIRFKKNKLSLSFYGTINKYSDPSFFVNILNDIVSENKNIIDCLELKTIGKEFYNNWGINLNKNIKLYRLGYVYHEEGIIELIKSDLILFTLSKNVSQGLIPGRIFEIIATRRPILAVIPDIELKEILDNLKNVYVYDHSETEKIKRFLKEFLIENINNLNKDNIWEFIPVYEDFTREMAALKFIEIFEKLKGK